MLFFVDFQVFLPDDDFELPEQEGDPFDEEQILPSFGGEVVVADLLLEQFEDILQLVVDHEGPLDQKRGEEEGFLVLGGEELEVDEVKGDFEVHLRVFALNHVQNLRTDL